MAADVTSYTIQFQGDDMSPSPSRWTDRGIEASQQIFFWWGYIFFPDRNPILVMRSFPGAEMMGGPMPLCHVECRKGMFVQPKMLDMNMPSEDAVISPYHLCEDTPEGYGADGDQVFETSILEGDQTKVLYRAGTRRAYIKEGDILEAQGENMEYAMCIDPPGIFGPYFTWGTVFKGTYCGEEVTFMGGSDRFFSAQEAANLEDKNAYYWGCIISGIDADDRKEYGCFYMYNGRTFAYYVRDGEEPKYSEDVHYEADWAVDPANPDSIAPRSMVWGFDDVEVHWKAEYCSVYNMGFSINHLGSWYEKNGSRDFTHYLGVFETNIRPEHIK